MLAIKELRQDVETLKKKHLPIEILYDLDVASTLIPLAKDRLRWFLHNHKEEFPAIYRKSRTQSRRRVLPGFEILKIRRMVLKGPGLLNVI